MNHLFKIVSFQYCGSLYQTSCTNYFLKNQNITSLVGVNYLRSWIFSLNEGVNNLTIAETDVYKMGSMILITPLDNNAIIKMFNVSSNTGDYEFGPAITKIKPNDTSNFFRLCVRALTTRYYYNLTNGSTSLTFNTSGTYTLYLNTSNSQINYAKSNVFTVLVLPS